MKLAVWVQLIGDKNEMRFNLSSEKDILICFGSRDSIEHTSKFKLT